MKDIMLKMTFEKSCDKNKFSIYYHQNEIDLLDIMQNHDPNYKYK